MGLASGPNQKTSFLGHKRIHPYIRPTIQFFMARVRDMKQIHLEEYNYLACRWHLKERRFNIRLKTACYGLSTSGGLTCNKMPSQIRCCISADTTRQPASCQASFCPLSN
ncbi:hypothetical protein RJ55_05300 [Drechmeria coniospora]|nr:hypothetical protein RJ55_05300 [Drechmeria coniospora]